MRISIVVFMFILIGCGSEPKNEQIRQEVIDEAVNDVQQMVKDRMYPRANVASAFFDVLRDTLSTINEKQTALDSINLKYDRSFSLTGHPNLSEALAKEQLKVISQIKNECIEEVRSIILESR